MVHTSFGYSIFVFEFEIFIAEEFLFVGDRAVINYFIVFSILIRRTRRRRFACFYALCNRLAFSAFRHLGSTQIRIVNGRTVVQRGGRIYGVRAGHGRVLRFVVVVHFVRLDNVVVVVVVIVEIFARGVLGPIGDLVVIFEFFEVEHLVSWIQGGQIRREAWFAGNN